MLSRLQVRRLAVIEDLQVQFADGLNVLTGETGAGKSILVTAIGLALGWRATSDLIRTGCEDAEVIAEFVRPPESANQLLVELGATPDDRFDVRRVISATGRNRVFVGGQEGALAGLRKVGEAMLNLYGQHEAQGLMRPETHLPYLDEYAGVGDDRRAVGRQVARRRELDAHLSRLEKQETERDARENYLRFVIEEIDAAAIGDNEDAQLDARIKVLANAETLLRTGRAACDRLYDMDEGAVAETVGVLLREVEEKTPLDEGLAPLAEGLRELLVLAEDLAARARDYADTLEIDPAAHSEMEDRRQLLRDLKKKYGGSLDAVHRTRDQAEAESASLGRLTEEILALTAERRNVDQALTDAAMALSAARAKAAKKMQREVERELADLDMKGTRFVVAVEPLAKGGLELGELRIDEDGADQVEFLISPNVGELPRPLARIASGGELSRIMLAIKRVLARHFPVPTLIFDEIDAGVGGAQAERLGRKLREVAGDHQVLCITHLPQIAALADHHFVVTKQAVKGRTKTDVRELDDAERVAELARMLGGEAVTDVVRAAAAELLAWRQAPQQP